MVIRTILEGIAVALAIYGFAKRQKLLDWENRMIDKFFGGNEDV